MKKLIIVSSIMLSSLACMSSATAQVFATVVINCPVTSGSPANQLRNFANSYIAGIGIETIDIGAGPQPAVAAFKTNGALPAGIPGNLSTYSSASTNFNNTDPGNPFVTCNYTSTNPAFPNFSVNYLLLNGFGAAFSSSTATSVTLNLPVGLKA